MSTPIQPKVDPDSERFWAATASGSLELCWCPSCARYRHPPVDTCPQCWAPTSSKPVSGGGTLFSYIVVHRPVAPGYPERNVVALVELEDQPGLRLSGQLLDVAEPQIGMPLRATLEPLPGGQHSLPVWRPT